MAQLLPNAQHFKEFYGHNGDCLQCSLAAGMVTLESAVENKQQAIVLMNELVTDMAAHGLAAANGVATLAAGKAELERKGYEIVAYMPFNASMSAADLDALHIAIRDHLAGKTPFVLQVGEAFNLHAVNGGQDEAAVHEHFIAGLGEDTTGYVMNDGDDSEIEAHLVVYPWATLVAAKPQGLLAFRKPVAKPTANAPEGWTDDGKTLTAPNHVSVVLGFRAHVLASGWDKDNWPLAAETGDANGTSQVFRTKQLFYSSATQSISEEWCGNTCLALTATLALNKTQIEALQQQLQDASKASPAELASLLASVSNLCNPFVSLAQEVTALQQKLG